jgi:hypothetical protein
MNIRVGNRVMVNLAPFIGSKVRSLQSIPCQVRAVEGGHLQVTSEFPYRSVTLWIPPRWIEAGRGDRLEETAEAACS